MRRLLVYVTVIAVIAAASTGAITGLIVKSSIDSANAQQAMRLFHAQINGCGRQNVRTAATNRNALAEYRFNSLFAAALTRPPQRPQTAQEKQLTAKFRGRLGLLVSSLTWTPLNHACATDPTTVQLPVAFVERRPKPADLRVRP